MSEQAVDEVKPKEADKSETKPKKKRTPKRLDAAAIKERIAGYKKKAADKGKEYRGVEAKNVKFDTLRYDEEKKRQVVDIATVGEDGKADGGERTVATSDLQHVRYSIDVAKKISKAKSNARRREKREAAKAND